MSFGFGILNTSLTDDLLAKRDAFDFDYDTEFVFDFDAALDVDTNLDLGDSFVFDPVPPAHPAPTFGGGLQADAFAVAGPGFASAGFFGSASGSGFSSVSGSVSAGVGANGSSFASSSGSVASGGSSLGDSASASWNPWNEAGPTSLEPFEPVFMADPFPAAPAVVDLPDFGGSFDFSDWSF